MPFRVSILDLTATIILVVMLVLPPQSVDVAPAYAASQAQLQAISLEQARLAANPGDAEAASRLAELLTAAKQTDWAVQVAGESVKHAGALTWRALLAVSTAHAERIEVVEAHRYAEQALQACRRAGQEACPTHEAVRLQFYTSQLAAGVRSGIDPRHDPRGYERAVLADTRTGFLRFDTAEPTSGDAKAPEGAGEDSSPPGTRSSKPQRKDRGRLE